jgi:quercetin dioxygenase-like cupin family protein
MIQVTSWDKLASEDLSPTISRQMFSGDHSTLARFLLKRGTKVQRHAHNSEQFSMVLSGALKFIFDDREVVIRAGEILFIPSNVAHAAEALEDTEDLDVFSPRREDWILKEDGYLRGTPKR